MSYCRWSQCDLYVYHSVGGFISINVADRRLRAGASEPQTIEEILNSDDRFEDIGLPCDGATYEETTFQAAADRVRLLKTLGYDVPQDVIDELQAQADAGEEVT